MDSPTYAVEAAATRPRPTKARTPTPEELLALARGHLGAKWPTLEPKLRVLVSKEEFRAKMWVAISHKGTRRRFYQRVARRRTVVSQRHYASKVRQLREAYSVSLKEAREVARGAGRVPVVHFVSGKRQYSRPRQKWRA